MQRGQEGDQEKRRVQPRDGDDNNVGGLSRRIHKCTRCQDFEHDKSTCKHRINPPSGQASQPSGSDEVARSKQQP